VSRASSRLLYDAEIWTIKVTDSREVLVLEVRCYRRILKYAARTESVTKLLKKK